MQKARVTLTLRTCAQDLHLRPNSEAILRHPHIVGNNRFGLSLLRGRSCCIVLPWHVSQEEDRVGEVLVVSR